MKADHQSKKHIVKFIIATFFITYSFTAWIISSGGIKNFGIWTLVFLMWIPGTTALAYRLLARIGFDDVGFKIGPLKYYLLAILVPLVLAIVTNFTSTLFSIRELALLPRELWSKFAPVLLISLVAGILGAVGEEIGWRGFLIPKILGIRIEYPRSVAGFVWALWHLPLITFGGYYKTDSLLLIAISYTLSVLGISYFFGWIRLNSGSVWAAALAHASHNFFFQLFVPHIFFSKEGENKIWYEIVGADAGFVPAALYLALAFFARKLVVSNDAEKNLSTGKI